MDSIFFWKSWDTSIKYLYGALLCVLLAATVGLVYFGFASTDAIIPWQIIYVEDSIKYAVDTLQLGVFEISIDMSLPIYFTKWVGGFESQSSVAIYYIAPALFIVLWMALVALTYTTGWAYYIGTTAVLAYITFQQAESSLDYSYFVWVKILPIILLGGLSYFYSYFRNHASVWERCLSFGLAISIYIFLLSYINQGMHWVEMGFAFSAHIGLIISILFLYLIGFEPIYFLLQNSTQGKQFRQQSSAQYAIGFLLYFGYLVLHYCYNAHIFQLNLWYPSPLVYAAMSIILGIWGFKDRSALFQRILPFSPVGALLYVAWALFTVLFISIAFIQYNDPAIEVIEDCILWSQLGMGLGFFLYTITQFGPWLNSDIEIGKVIYKIQTNSFTLIYGVGFLITLLFLSYGRMFTYNQWLAAQQNMIATAYVHKGLPEIAIRYYEEALVHEFQNHKSNYDLAYLYLDKQQKKEAYKYAKKALLKKPTAQAYTLLALLNEQDENELESILILKEGSRLFQNSPQIQTALAWHFQKLKMYDSAYVYINRALENTHQNFQSQSNRLAFFMKSGIIPPLSDESLKWISGTEALHWNVNLLTFQTLQKNSLGWQNMHVAMTDSILSNVEAQIIYTHLLNNVGTLPDSQTIAWIENITALDSNTAHAVSIRHALSISFFLGGKTIQACKKLDDLQNTDVAKAGDYIHHLAFIYLKNRHYQVAAGLYNRLTPYFPQLYFYKSIADLEQGNKIDAIQSWNSKLDFLDTLNNGFFQRLMIQIAFTSVQDILRHSDAVKFRFLYYNKAKLSTSDIGNILFSMQDSIYTYKAAVACFYVYLNRKDTAICKDILTLISHRNLHKLNTTFYEKFLELSARYYLLTNNLDALRHAKPINRQDYWMDWSLARVAQANKSPEASTWYTSALEKGALDVALRLEVIEWFSSMQMSKKAYDVALEGIQLVPSSAALYKAYIMQAIRFGIPQFADNALPTLQSMISMAEYKQFLKEVEKEKAMLYSAFP